MRPLRALRGRALGRLARERNPFPSGSVTIAAWLVIAGVTAYLFLAVSGRALGSERYSALAVLWAIAFAGAPGKPAKAAKKPAKKSVKAAKATKKAKKPKKK